MRTGPIVLMLAGVACVSATSGCTGARAPSFRVVEAELTDQSASGYVVTFILEGENENDFPLPLRDVTYDLSLDGERVFSGQRSAEATIPGDGTQRVVMPVSIVLEEGAAIPDRASYTLSGRVTYVLPGAIAELFFDNNIRRPRVGFSESGDLVRD